MERHSHPYRVSTNPLGSLSRLRRTIVFALAATGLFGCIERTVTINTEPQEATVFLNDQEVGKSPVKVPFTWYGDYDIIIRKPGFETIRTHRRIRTPWYQLPGIDIITETMIPFTVHDDHVLETFMLQAKAPIDKRELLESADAMQQQALNPPS